MSEQLKFFKGNEANLPSVFEPGAIYHCIDTGNTYLAIDSSNLTLYSNTFKIYKQNEAPTNPEEGTLWLDLNEQIPVLKIYISGKWEAVTQKSQVQIITWGADD